MNEVGSVGMYVREIDVYSSSLHHPPLVNLPLSARVVSGELDAPGLCCAGRQSDHRIIRSLHMYKNGFVDGRRFRVASWEASCLRDVRLKAEGCATF